MSTEFSQKIITSCPNCSQKLRAPGNLGELKLTCPTCRHSWLWSPTSVSGDTYTRKQISPLVGSAVGWMYANRMLLSKGYSGEDPAFSEAKAVFLQGMRKSFPNETDESLMQVFEQALNMV